VFAAVHSLLTIYLGQWYGFNYNPNVHTAIVVLDGAGLAPAYRFKDISPIGFEGEPVQLRKNRLPTRRTETRI
jgi:hypothetical protein